MARPKPVAAYPTEYLSLFLRASDGKVEFALKYGDAVHYRQQLYQLRMSMRKEKHPLINSAENVTIRITPDPAPKDTQVVLALEPKSNNPFAKLIKEKIGDVQIKDVEESTFEELTSEDKIKEFEEMLTQAENKPGEEVTDFKGMLALGDDEEEEE